MIPDCPKKAKQPSHERIVTGHYMKRRKAGEDANKISPGGVTKVPRNGTRLRKT
jgi:hypothetical protein